MAMNKTTQKLEKYQDRLKAGKAEKIKPKHVEKILDKLTAKQTEIGTELAAATKESKRERLEHKQVTVNELIEKARWLQSQI